jgi:uncharacterized protein YdeI (YjbR/CyaY-like superfamily)
MEVGRTLYVTERKAWRAWLARHHATAPEVWLVSYRKETGKARLPYNDAVEEALCYGWIDSIMKPLGAGKFCQRFSPRRAQSVLSPMNRERVRRLIRTRRMTRFGLEKVRHLLHPTDLKRRSSARERFRLPKDIEAALREDPVVWRNFQRFPASYKRIRVGWIDGARARPEAFAARLRHFLKMTAKNTRFGMVQ